MICTKKWGRGINLILSKEPETEFKEIGRQFIVSFKRKSNHSKTTQKTTRKTTQKIIDIIVNNPQITREELASLLKLSSDGIKYHLNNLKKIGILIRVGGRKQGKWVINKNANIIKTKKE